MDVENRDPPPFYKRNEIERILSGAPVDLSFQNAKNMGELGNKSAQSVRTGKLPLRTSNNLYMSGTLWLSHNMLTTMNGLQDLVKNVLFNPMYLSWLDLSFNTIHEIGDEIVEFQNLKIVYLHENDIFNINDAMKLRKLRNLKSLSLNGNPVSEFPYYRGYIVHILPQLVNFDFSVISEAERKNVHPAGFFKLIRTYAQNNVETNNS